MLSPAHVRSGQVMTVLGPVPAGQLGPTLMHEHLLNDCRCWWHRPTQPDRQHLATASVSAAILGELRMDPFVCLDNCALDDEAAAVDEAVVEPLPKRRHRFSEKDDLRSKIREALIGIRNPQQNQSSYRPLRCVPTIDLKSICLKSIRIKS